MNGGPARVPNQSARRTNEPERPLSHVSPSPSRPPVKKSKLPLVISLIVGVVIILALVAGGMLLLRGSSAAAQIDGSKYQAVFFTNGQVYFGKLKSLSSGYFELTDIFYLQAKNTDGSNPQKTDSESPDLQLTPLGSEIHGPENEMIVNRDQVLFFENLKPDGKVSMTIEKYNSDKK